MSKPIRCYLAVAEGRWTLMRDHQPLCAATTRQDAETVARTFRLVPEAVWDGDAGEWLPLDSFRHPTGPGALKPDVLPVVPHVAVVPSPLREAAEAFMRGREARRRAREGRDEDVDQDYEHHDIDV